VVVDDDDTGAEGAVQAMTQAERCKRSVSRLATKADHARTGL
jgi:hypothetical protein